MHTNQLTPSLTSFTFAPGLDLRTITRDGEPWFLAVDVCKALGIQNATDAVYEISDEDKLRQSLGLRGRTPWLINETGLYALVFKSRKANAKAFQKWVTGTVLPTIRKTGMYLTPKVAKEVVERPEVFLARALVLAHDTINGLKEQASLGSVKSFYVSIGEPAKLF